MESYECLWNKLRAGDENNSRFSRTYVSEQVGKHATTQTKQASAEATRKQRILGTAFVEQRK